MSNFELLSDRMEKARLQRRRNDESERRERIFNHKVRTIGVDKDALDLQIKEKQRQEEAEKETQDTYDAEILHDSKMLSLLHNKQVKERQAMEKAIVDYRHEYQQPQRGLDGRRTEDGGAQMILPGLVGEDPDSKSRRQRQKDQLRGWLIQQQSERAAERRQQKMEEQCYDQSRAEMDSRALQLHSLEAERRKAETVATKDFNLAKIEEKECHRRSDLNEEGASSMNHQQEPLMDEDATNTPGMMGVSGPSSERGAPSESLQQLVQFQKLQIEEKKRMEQKKKLEEEQLDRVRLDSTRSALLIERQQARLNKELRRHLDSTNLHLAETHKQQKPDIKKGGIDDSFFSQFNTCSR
ncbi:RIB43A-like with coiled-coils protein 2 [Cheilinus undulatus]|uniref:RIB43A-like with coiled-coils protein 2 n=1 Tax=Cheilinus undulatus TaxID=241271 RepID=UPI001BD61DF8|nr:RIB43A-like with coiled-coils protein 2 [Cheilinus undulatus]